jgi:hypothetical protein
MSAACNTWPQFVECHRCVIISRSLATASNSGDYSASRAEVLSSHTPVQTDYSQSYITTDGQSTKL